MKNWRYFLASAVILCSTILCAGAASAPTLEEATQQAITHYQSLAQNGEDMSRGTPFKGDNFRAWLHPLRPDQNLYRLSVDIDGEYNSADNGLLNLQTGKLVAPLEFIHIEKLSDGRLFLLKYAKDENSETSNARNECYYLDLQGQLIPTALPKDGSWFQLIDGDVIVLLDYAERPLSNTMVSWDPNDPYIELYPIARLILIDKDMNIIRDDVDGGTGQIMPMEFYNGLTYIRTGSTLWIGTPKFAEGNGKCVLIDKTGKEIGAHDFDDISFLHGHFIGTRGEGKSAKEYLLDGKGGERLLTAADDRYSAWAQAEAAAAKEHGITIDYISYPRLDINREYFCDFAMRLYRVLKPADSDVDYDDTQFSDCYDSSVRAAAKLGFITGYEDGTFRPYDFITREQAATILGRMYRLLGSNTPDAPADASPYADDDMLSDWARSDIYTMREIGIMKGGEFNRFNPHNNYSTEQTIVTLERMYQLLKK